MNIYWRYFAQIVENYVSKLTIMYMLPQTIETTS